MDARLIDRHERLPSPVAGSKALCLREKVQVSAAAQVFRDYLTRHVIRSERVYGSEIAWSPHTRRLRSDLQRNTCPGLGHHLYFGASKSCIRAIRSPATVDLFRDTNRPSVCLADGRPVLCSSLCSGCSGQNEIDISRGPFGCRHWTLEFGIGIGGLECSCLDELFG